jgi:hypothetical protein
MMQSVTIPVEQPVFLDKPAIPTGVSDRTCTIVALLLSAFYLATSIYIASHRLYWFDELFILRIAKLPDAGAMWRALAHAADTMPPGYHLLMRLIGHTLGYSEVAMRLPSALAMVAGLLITFDCVRRLTDGPHGLIAFSALTCSLLPYYGYEARPYAFCFLLSALALWIWIAFPRDTLWAACSFGAVLFLAVTMHYYAVLGILPYVLWECSNAGSRKAPSLKLIAGLTGVIAAAIAMAPLAMAFSRQFSSNFWAAPSVFRLREGFDELFPQSLFLLAAITIWIVLFRRHDARVVGSRAPAESLGWLFFCIPIAGFMAAELKTNAFLIRYFICVLPGVVLAFSCLLWRHRFNSLYVTAGTLALLMVWGVAAQWYTILHPERIDPFGQQTATRQYLQLEDSVLANGKHFVLFDNPMLHLEATHYSRHPEECLLLLRDREKEDIPTARVQVNLSYFSPMTFWRLDDVKRHADDTALIDPSPETLRALNQAGVRVSVRFSKPMEVVYLQ